MPVAIYSFSVQHPHSPAESVDLDLPDDLSAWAEAVIACGDSLRDMNSRFGPADEWSITVTDQARTPLFEIRCTSKHFDRR
ncbi:hypothetical protein [Aliihoeflea sp. 40Bstr573]|uniref:DUF6894 family protein n=1 Tax=Aliihoeflea sp. 40Bstr573 TaxID=2696467 RepID=UPI003531D72B